MGQQVIVPLVGQGLGLVRQSAIDEQEQVGRGSLDGRVSDGRGRVGRVEPEAFGPQTDDPGVVSIGRAEADGRVGATQVGHLGGERRGEGQVDEELGDPVDREGAVDRGPQAECELGVGPVVACT